MPIWFFAIAALLLVLIPIAPRLLRIRVRVLRWLRWNWAANLIENRFEMWVVVARVLLAVIAAALLFFGWQELQG